MSNYTIVNGELYHYGVKGMKWGRRKAVAKAERKYARAGKHLGKADYYREKGDNAYQQHERNAKVFDKAAKKYESQGSVFKAEASRKAAAALRQRGANVRAESIKVAESWTKSGNKLNQKADKFATKKRCDLGKAKIDSIMKESKKKGYNSAKNIDTAQREAEIEERLGSNGYNTYNRLRGID